MEDGGKDPKLNGPGVTTLGFYDKKYDEIVLVEAFHGMRVRGDMRGWHRIAHFVPAGRVGVGWLRHATSAVHYFGDSRWTECPGGLTMI